MINTVVQSVYQKKLKQTSEKNVFVIINMFAVLPLVTVSLAYAAKRYHRNNKKYYAATKIQSIFRMYIQRKKFKVILLISKQIKKYKHDLEANQNENQYESDENDYFNFIKKMRKSIKKRGNNRRAKR